MKGLEKYANRIVAAFLLIIGIIMALSVKDDTLTSDEGLYLPTGYRFLTEQNGRHGFEHPPLMREIAALPLVLYLDLKPAADFINADNKDINNEVWLFGDKFIYSQDTSPEVILLLGRLPMIACCLCFLYFVYCVIRDRYGHLAGVTTTVLLASSPFFLAHGRLVTLDVPTAMGSFLFLYAFACFLERGDRASMVWAGLALGVAQLIKFAMLTLVPFSIVLGLAYVFLFRRDQVLKYLRGAAGVAAIAFIVVGCVYAFHMQNYPAAQQIADTDFVLSTTRAGIYPKLRWISWLAQFSFARPWAEYFFGVAWQLTRHGAFGYFMGEGSNTSWRLFYPVGYLLKQPLTFHVLTLIAAFQLCRELTKTPPKKMLALVREHFFLCMGGLWIAFYLYILIWINSGNTGSRYLLPIMPFVGAICAVSATRWMLTGKFRTAKVAALGACLVGQLVAVMSAYPSFLAFFNSLVGPIRGSYYLVDTDAEWGQDVKRLDVWLREHKVPFVHVAMEFAFQEADSGQKGKSWVYSNSYKHYLEGRFDWLPTDGSKAIGWVAVPARLLRWGQARPAPKEGWSSDSYMWLANHEPDAVIGNSIFVYNIKP